MTTNPVASVPGTDQDKRAVASVGNLFEWMMSRFAEWRPIAVCLPFTNGYTIGIQKADVERLEAVYAESFASVGRNLEAERSNQ